MESHWVIVNRGGSEVASNTPENLWFNACKYFKWCDENPIRSKKTLTSGKNAKEKMDIEHARPYSVKGLCLHCNISEEYLKDLRQTKDKNSDYYIVASKIMYLIYVQNLEYAIVGVFNPIFTAKVLNMGTDDSPTGSIKVEVVQGLPALSGSENEILENMDLELKQNQNLGL